MSVADVKLYPVRIECTHPGPELPDIREHFILRVESDRGLVGWGEISGKHCRYPISPSYTDVLLEWLRTVLVGEDPAHIVRVRAKIDALMPMGFLTDGIRCGVELALYDLLGKQIGIPVHVLLGGALRQEIDVAYPIPAHTRKQDVARSIDYVGTMLKRGYSLIRFYIGLNLEADALFLVQLREKYGDSVKIKTLDCNCHLDWKDARAALRKFEEYGFMLVESPARRGDLEGLSEVRRSIDAPVSEHAYTIADAKRLAATSAVDVFNITMVGAGGFLNAQRIAAIAEMNGIRCVLGGSHELVLGAAGQAHIGAGLPHLAFPIDTSGTIIYADTIAPSTELYRNGVLRVPEGPGLGVEVDEERLIALAPV
jgi:galactarate dehydratase (D-threo-forming)